MHPLRLEVLLAGLTPVLALSGMSGTDFGGGPNMIPRNVTLDDGSVDVIWLHHSFHSSDANTTTTTTTTNSSSPHGHDKRMKFQGGSQSNQCGDSSFTDKTTSGSESHPSPLTPIPQPLFLLF
jgi:hypothetical protein